MDADATGHILVNDGRTDWPVVVSVPHAGRAYGPEVLEALAVAPDHLLRLEDRYADLIARGAAGIGVPVLTAIAPRAYIDLNRAEGEIDVGMVDGLDARRLPAPTAKQRGGLGLIPRRLAGAGELWKRKLSRVEVEGRIAQGHRPYHATLARLLDTRRRRHGEAVLLDLHSMPPVGRDSLGRGETAPRIVIGNLFGRSASDHVAALAMRVAQRHGLTAALNVPYSGGHILRRHGAPQHGVQALQIEIDRSLYLDSSLAEPTEGVEQVSRFFADLARTLAEDLANRQLPQAAE